MSVQGTLIPIGGNENKGINTNEKFHLENIEEGILARVVQESGGKDALIVVIPTASSIPDRVCENYRQAFDRLNCTNVKMLDIRKREESELQENIELVKAADCIMFSGGNQFEITYKIGGTKIHEILLNRFNNEGLIVAGTSAGAMCMSTEMISGGSGKEAFVKGAVMMRQGMGFVPSLIIDSHFIRRGRFGRLAEAVAKFPHLIGIGLAEDTGLVIKNCNTFEVVGSGMVIIFDPSDLLHNNESFVDKGEPMSLTNLKTHILAKGDRFNIEKHMVKILHVDTVEAGS